MSASYIALAQTVVCERALAVIANNLANSTTTPGYQADSPFMVALNLGKGKDTTSFVHDNGIVRDTSVGRINATNSPLDLAIQGHGYFAIQTQQGIRYTRCGAFTKDSEGKIVTLQGDPLLDSGDSPIIIPPETKTIKILPDGTIQTELGVITTLAVQQFENENDLKKAANGLFETNATPSISETVVPILQGCLESSNVSPTKEMVRMIEVERRYQEAQKIIQQETENTRKATEILASAL